MTNFKSINDVAYIVRGVSYKPSDASDKKIDGYIPILRGMNIQEGSLNFDDLIYINPKCVNTVQKIQNGDVVIVASTGSKKVIGKAAQSKRNWDGSFGAFCMVLRPKDQLIDKDYFGYFFQSSYYRSKISYMSSGANINNLKREYFDRLQIAVLPESEQKEVVKVIYQTEVLRQKRVQAIDLLDEYIKSVFLEMFGDPVVNPKGWEIRELKSFGEIITGNTPPRNEDDNYSSNYVEWIKTDNIVEDKIYLTTANEYLSEKGLSRARFVDHGAVLVACIAGSIASIGRAAIANRKLSFNQQINAIQPNDKVNPVFLYWLLRTSRKYVQNHATKGMKRILTKGEFEKIKLILPPVDLQNMFAKIALDTELLKQKMSEQSVELDNQFKAILQKSFNGN